MTIETDLLPMPKGVAIGMYQAWSYDQMCNRMEVDATGRSERLRRWPRSQEAEE